jgi:hypothetical protein
MILADENTSAAIPRDMMLTSRESRCCEVNSHTAGGRELNISTKLQWAMRTKMPPIAHCDRLRET